MSKLKHILSNTKTRVMAGVLVAALVVGTVSIGLASTFAGANDITKTFEQPDTYTPLAFGVSVQPFSGGLSNARTSDSNIATYTLLTGGALKVTAGSTKAGVVSIASAGQFGQAYVSTYHVYDPNGIAGYRISGGEMQISKVTGNSVPIDAKVITGNGEQTLSEWNAANPANIVAWESMHPEVIEVASGDSIKAIANGSAILVGTVTDKWGVTQTIPVLVTVGKDENLSIIDDGTGNYWLETDIANVYVEANEDGEVKIPLRIIYNPDGPGSNTPNIELYLGDAGKYYVVDGLNPNIWHEFDLETGTTMEGSSIWGGANGQPGGGDDVRAIYDESTGNWWADLGQNIFDRINPNGTLANNLTGGGTDSIPWTNPVQPIWYEANTGKYYVGPLVDEDGNIYYYGDALGSTDGVQSSTTTLAETDAIWYMDSDGIMTLTKPLGIPTLTGISIATPPTKTEYTVGDLFEPTGMNILLTYSDGSTKIVDSGYTYTPTSAFTTVGDAIPVTIVFGDQTVTQNVKVTETGSAISEIPSDGTGRILTTSKSGDTSEWVEIATNGGYSLIIRSNNIVSSTKFRSSGNAYSGSTVETLVNNWFNNTLASNATLRNYTVTHDALSKLGTWNNASAVNNFSVPTGTLASTGDDVAFILSFGEAANFCSYRSSSSSGYAYSSNQAYANWKLLSDETSTRWWLRGSGFSSSRAALAFSNGSIEDDPVTCTWAVRPALWIKSTIFD